VSHDAKAKTCTLEIAQMLAPTPGQAVKEPAVIPLALGLVAPDGSDIPLTLAGGGGVERGVLVLTRPAETFVFADVPARPVASLNRGFSAPVRLSANLTGDDLRLLVAHDSDPFNRWQALQTLGTTLLTDNVAALRAGRPTRDDPGLIAALAAVLAEPALEPAFLAQMLAVPTEADVAREIGRDVDPDAIFAARRALRAAIGNALGPALREAYRRLADAGPYSPDAGSAGRRSLKNIALDLLAASGSSAAIALAARQYQTADNMTDRMAAMMTLSLHPVRERQAAIDDFYRRYQSDPLVIDKWLSLQAAIPEAGTLDRVRELTRHPAFSLGNPNRVRSLIGAFAQANQTQFNRADGVGYAFVADTVLALDGANAQVASRMMTAFKSWRALESGRRGKAEAELRRVAATPTLSANVRDIVQCSLADD
jgi:aminopeptidase N